MRKLFGLFILLFLIGCNKEIVVTEEIPIEPEKPDFSKFDWFHVEDTVGFQDESIFINSIRDTTWIFGVKNKKAWLGCFNTNTKKQLTDWISIDEYSYRKGSTISISSINNSSNFLFSIKSPAEKESYFIRDIFLLENGKMIFLNKSECFYGNDITAQILDDNILLYEYSDYGAFLFSKEGKELANTISISEDPTSGNYNLLGIKNKKIWYAIIENNKITEEYIGEEDFNSNRNVHIGYGEYIDFNIERFVFDKTIKTEWGFVLSPQYIDLQKNDWNRLCLDILICDNGLIKRINAPESFSLLNWYEDSFMVFKFGNGARGTYFIYSKYGDLLLKENYNELSFTTPIFTSSYIFPISLNEYLWTDLRASSDNSYNIFIRKYKLENSPTEAIWQQDVLTVYSLENKPSVVWNLLDKNNNVWSFLLNIVTYDGKKQEYQFNIDTENGNIDL